MQTRLYFAYGSNMNKAQMAARCPGSRRLGPAALPGYRWVVAADGYANAIASAMDTVEGILFDITASDEAELDSYEDVVGGCYARHVLPVLYAGAVVHALVYLNPLTATGSVAPDHLEQLSTALFVDGGLSEAYLTRYIYPFIHP